MISSIRNGIAKPQLSNAIFCTRQTLETKFPLSHVLFLLIFQQVFRRALIQLLASARKIPVITKTYGISQLGDALVGIATVAFNNPFDPVFGYVGFDCYTFRFFNVAVEGSALHTHRAGNGIYIQFLVAILIEPGI